MHRANPRLERFVRLTEWPLAILALIAIPTLLLDDHSNGLRFHRVSETLNWIVWVAFCGELLIKAGLSDNAKRFWRDAWLDVAIVVISPPFLSAEYLQGFRILRLARFSRLTRLFRALRAFGVLGIALESIRDVLQQRRFQYIVALMGIILSVGAFAIYGAEYGRNKDIQSLGDAFWWSIVTATTVGYGDISPQTVEGRLIAIVLMFVGIGFIGIFTGTIASVILDPHKKDRSQEFLELQKQIKRLEQKQDELLAVVIAQQSVGRESSITSPAFTVHEPRRTSLLE